MGVVERGRESEVSVSQYVVKVAVTAILVVVISEVSKRSSVAGALLASIPVLSVLAMFWLYQDTRDTVAVAGLARGIFWLVLPSLALFVILPLLLGRGYGFYGSMAVAIGATIGCYFAMIAVLRSVGLWAE